MHIWLAALVLAACAPWCVRFAADALERSSKRRTDALVVRARGRGIAASRPEGEPPLAG
jgi:hypothetical protein